uniref:Putative Flp pilus-assembly TadG-like N-terminal domain-containing protein n=1 Tax=Rhodopseudomonas palustris (strain DX-1) TaxID=652103 RepID=E6VCR3_RHOPX
MYIASLAARLNRAARRFPAASGGNIAVIFGIALLPLLGFVGAAVDYSRASRARTAMQSALDSTALMVAKDLTSGKITAENVQSAANTYFTSLYKNTDAPSIDVTATYTPKTSSENAKLTVGGTGSINTEFMKVMNISQMSLGASSTTTWGGTRLRVALALDVTGSMDSAGKLSAMKTAAKQLIDTLKATSTTKEDVYISIVPFNVMVNVGPGNKNATWLDWDTSYGSCKSKYTTKNACQAGGDSWNYWSNTCQSQKTLKSACQAGGHTWTASNVNSWKGCVTDRTQNYDTTKTEPTSATPDTLFLAQNYSDCMASLLPMKSAYEATESDSSTDATTLKGRINTLDAQGGTNQGIGMFWAWMTLQATAPLYTPAKDSEYKYTDAIVLLSDGMNTKNRWYGNGSNWSPQVDDRQKILCDNITTKVNGVPETTIYTIQVNTSGDPESSVLKYCGSTGGFFSTTTASGIQSAFQEVGASLTKLRIAK